MVWGPAQWLKELPYANAAAEIQFQARPAGTSTFWNFGSRPSITPAPKARSARWNRVLKENKIIGLSFALIDYDDVHSGDTNNGFWNLSRHHTMYGQADYLCAFKLMPLEPQFQKPIEAQWSFQVVDMDRRLVAFKDLSVGEINSWHWDFGDGETSTEQNPIHAYKNPDHYVVVLDVEGPAGKSRLAKVWDVVVK